MYIYIFDLHHAKTESIICNLANIVVIYFGELWIRNFSINKIITIIIYSSVCVVQIGAWAPTQHINVRNDSENEIKQKQKERKKEENRNKFPKRS